VLIALAKSKVKTPAAVMWSRINKNSKAYFTQGSQETLCSTLHVVWVPA